jgi:hypothetical protein
MNPNPIEDPLRTLFKKPKFNRNGWIIFEDSSRYIVYQVDFKRKQVYKCVKELPKEWFKKVRIRELIEVADNQGWVPSRISFRKNKYLKLIYIKIP